MLSIIIRNISKYLLNARPTEYCRVRYRLRAVVNKNLYFCIFYCFNGYIIIIITMPWTGGGLDEDEMKIHPPSWGPENVRDRTCVAVVINRPPALTIAPERAYARKAKRSCLPRRSVACRTRARIVISDGRSPFAVPYMGAMRAQILGVLKLLKRKLNGVSP
jgi:hypothetical protein